MKTKIIATLLVIASIVGSLMMAFNQDYYEEVSREFVVLDKLESVTHSKYNATNNYILVLKTEDVITDLNVRPYVWSQAKIGDILYFEVTEQYLRRDSGREAISIIGFLLCTGGILLLCLMLVTEAMDE